MNKAFEKILERFDELQEKLLFSTISIEREFGIINAMEYSKKIVKEVAEEYNGGWIPCSERLPENNNVVLCWVVSKTIASGETFIIGSCYRGFWFLKTYEIGHHHFPVKDYEVVAWMPLPQPYQPKGE